MTWIRCLFHMSLTENLLKNILRVVFVFVFVFFKTNGDIFQEISQLPEIKFRV